MQKGYRIQINATKDGLPMSPEAMCETVKRMIDNNESGVLESGKADSALLKSYADLIGKLDGVERVSEGQLSHGPGLGGPFGWGLTVMIDHSAFKPISIDTHYGLSASINTDWFIDQCLESDETFQAMFEAYCDVEDVDGLEGVESFIETLGMKSNSGDNTYNYETNLDGIIQYTIGMKSHIEDWYYADQSDVLVFIQRHHGGDARCNYGSVEVMRFRCEDSAYAFISPTVGWSVFKCFNADGDEIEPEKSEISYDHFEEGYSSNPTYDLNEEIETVTDNNDDTVTVTFKNGESAVMCPTCRAEYL